MEGRGNKSLAEQSWLVSLQTTECVVTPISALRSSLLKEVRRREILRNFIHCDVLPSRSSASVLNSVVFRGTSGGTPVARGNTSQHKTKYKKNSYEFSLLLLLNPRKRTRQVKFKNFFFFTGCWSRLGVCTGGPSLFVTGGERHLGDIHDGLVAQLVASLCPQCRSHEPAVGRVKERGV